MSRIAKFLVAWVLFAFVVAIPTCLLVARCAQPHTYLLVRPPHRHCPITGLLLDDVSFLPEGRLGETRSPIPGGPLHIGSYEDAIRWIHWSDGFLVHEVHRERTADRAAVEVVSEKRGAFATTEFQGPWSLPAELGYRSPIADEYYVGCGRDRGQNVCKIVARYEEYWVSLHVPVEPSTSLTYEQLELLLAAVDQKMAGCLGKVAIEKKVELDTNLGFDDQPFPVTQGGMQRYQYNANGNMISRWQNEAIWREAEQWGYRRRSWSVAANKRSLTQEHFCPRSTEPTVTRT